MASVSGVVDRLNNKYLIAIIVALFLYTLIRRFV
jgi:hypothetical protein